MSTTEPEGTDPRCTEGKPLQTWTTKWEGEYPIVQIRELENGDFTVVMFSRTGAQAPAWVGTVAYLDAAEALAQAAADAITVVTRRYEADDAGDAGDAGNAGNAGEDPAPQ